MPRQEQMRQLDYAQMAEYARIIHLDDDGYIAIASKDIHGQFRQKHCHGIDELLDTMSETYSTKTDIYISVNSFYVPLRQAEALRRINAIYVDIDIHTQKTADSYAQIQNLLQIMYLEVFTFGNVPMPSMIVDSGRGIHLYWLLENLPGMAVNTYRNVAADLEAAISRRLEPYPECKVDAGVSTDTQRVMRLPGTYNPKSGRMCRILHRNTDLTYRLDEMREKYDYGKPRTSSKFFAVSGNPFFARVLTDLTKLRDLRADVEQPGRRRMTFLFRYYALMAGYDAEKAIQLTKEFNAGFRYPLPEEALVKHTASAQTAIKRGKVYRYKMTTLINNLGITKAEMDHLSVILDDITRMERRRARRRAQYANRGADGLTDKQREMEAARDVIERLVAGGRTQREIVSLTGYSLSKVKRIRAEISHKPRIQKRKSVAVGQKLKMVAGGSIFRPNDESVLTPAAAAVPRRWQNSIISGVEGVIAEGVVPDQAAVLLLNGYRPPPKA